MAKPDIPGELTDVHVNSISIVDKAANKRKFAIFKSAEAPAAENEPTELKRFFDVVKAFFLGEKPAPVEKGAVENIYNAETKSQKFWVAQRALCQTLGLAGDPDQLETNAAKIREALNEFVKIATEIMGGSDEDVKKFAEAAGKVEHVEKAGRKLSGARRAKLQSVYEAIGELLSETDDESGETGEGAVGNGGEVTKGAADMDSAKLNEVVKGILDEAMKPLAERIEKLEKAESEPAPANEPDQPDVAETVKAAVDEAIKPFVERLEKVEKARGTSNAVKDDASAVKKSAEDVFGGVFD